MKPVAKFIAEFEGYAKRLPNGNCTTYLDAVGVPTIGYGTTGRNVYLGLEITHDKAVEFLEEHIIYFENGALRLSPILSEYPNALLAITSFCYNLGLGAYQRSTLRKKINQGDWIEAKRQIKRWNKAGGRILRGLVRRREAEAELL